MLGDYDVCLKCGKRFICGKNNPLCYCDECSKLFEDIEDWETEDLKDEIMKIADELQNRKILLRDIVNLIYGGEMEDLE